jgi:GNAT superfamily N-acetyltransferase
LLRILWAHETEAARPRHTDAALMLRLIRRRAVRVIHDRRGPVGFIARQGPMVLALYVDPRAQGRGHGSALLTDAKARCPQLELWTLQENIPARRFYAAHGFVEVARGFGLGNDTGLPDIHLAWQKEFAA